MHAHVFHVGRRWALIRDCGKSCQSIFVHIYAQRCDAVDIDVDAQVKLKAVNEQGLMHISLHYHQWDGLRSYCLPVVGKGLLCHGCKGFRLPGQEDTSALACVLRFHYKRPRPFLIYLTHELLQVLR